MNTEPKELSLKETKDESFVSVVTVLNHNTVSSLERVTLLQRTLDEHYSDYEIILVVQKSMQGRAAGKIKQLLAEVPCIRYLQLSSDVNTDVIWSAGTENAIGDFVVCFDLRRDTAELVVKAVDLCKSGHDVVIGTVKERGSLGYRLLRPLAGWILKLIDYRLPKGATSFRCLSRRAVNAVMDTGKFYQQFFMQIQKTGYGYTALPYEEEDRNRQRNVSGGLRMVLRLMVFNTTLPLKIISILGLIGSTSAVLFSLYTFLLKFIKEDIVNGWSSTILIISMFAFIQFVILTFISAYLNRMLMEQSNSGEYSIVFEKNSAAMVSLDRLNVLNESENPSENLVQTGRDR